MKKTLLYILFSIVTLGAGAQGNEAYLQYISTYKDMAVEQMKRHGVPASITLAQGILESNAGRSILAVNANNHFGIKIGSSWTGDYIIKSDDRPDDKFRKYRSVAESYEDHSVFLQKQRYASLFQLDPKDYAGWAYGLKAAGYATNPQYPTLLINLIETYGLYAYDDLKNAGLHQPSGHSGMIGSHRLMLCNDVVYIRVQRGDCFETIAHETGISSKKLRKYNEVPVTYELSEGDVVYLGAKKKHAAKSVRGKYHQVAGGESMHSISQQYGIRMKKLYKWNNLPADYRIAEGDLLKLK